LLRSGAGLCAILLGDVQSILGAAELGFLAGGRPGRPRKDGPGRGAGGPLYRAYQIAGEGGYHDTGDTAADSQADQRRGRLFDIIYGGISFFRVPVRVAAAISLADSDQLAVAESLVPAPDTTDTGYRHRFRIGHMGDTDARFQTESQAEKAGHVRGMAFILVPGKSARGVEGRGGLGLSSFPIRR
jgi:hypothetical protein